MADCFTPKLVTEVPIECIRTRIDKYRKTPNLTGILYDTRPQVHCLFLPVTMVVSNGKFFDIGEEIEGASLRLDSRIERLDVGREVSEGDAYKCKLV